MFEQVALAKVSASRHIASMTDAKPHPHELSKQYDYALEQLYLAEWPDAVPEYKNRHRCCLCRDRERDNDSRKMLEKVFPSYLFHLLVFAGAIPPRSKLLFCLLTGCWIGYCVLLGFVACITTFAFNMNLWCLLTENCQMPTGQRFNFTYSLKLIFTFLPTIVTVVFVQTYLRDLLQSRELRTLITSVKPDRILKPDRHW